MTSEHEGDRPGSRADRLAAQEGAGELFRMGIDPRALGLDAFDPPAPAPSGLPYPTIPPGPLAARPTRDGPASAFRGVAPVPAPRPHQPLDAPVSPATVTPSPGAAVPDLPAPVPAAQASPTSAEESTLSRPLGGRPRRQEPASSAAAHIALLDKVADVPVMALPAGWRRTVRAVSFGVIQPGAAGVIQRERRLVAQVRARRPEPRVIAFLAGKGGVGTTTTAAGVALTLASLRNDTAALVSARSGAGSLGQRLPGRPAPTAGGVTAADPDHPDQPQWTRDSLAIFDGSPWHTPTPRGVLVQLLEDLRERHPLTLVDIGNELSETAHGALGRADQIVLVTTASQDALASTRVALSRVHRVDPYRLATVVVALTCLHRRQYRRTARRLREELGQSSTRIVPVPFDSGLTTGGQLDLTRTRPATREAYLRIAGLAIDPGEPAAWFTQPAEPGGPG